MKRTAILIVGLLLIGGVSCAPVPPNGEGGPITTAQADAPELRGQAAAKASAAQQAQDHVAQLTNDLQVAQRQAVDAQQAASEAQRLADAAQIKAQAQDAIAAGSLAAQASTLAAQAAVSSTLALQQVAATSAAISETVTLRSDNAQLKQQLAAALSASSGKDQQIASLNQTIARQSEQLTAALAPRVPVLAYVAIFAIVGFVGLVIYFLVVNRRAQAAQAAQLVYHLGASSGDQADQVVSHDPLS